LTIVWAIARDRDDDKATVLLAIADTQKRYDGVEVVGIDPFSNKSETVQHRANRWPGPRSSGCRANASPTCRAPSCASMRAAAWRRRSTTLGVPDTTPEFPERDQRRAAISARRRGDRAARARCARSMARARR